MTGHRDISRTAGPDLRAWGDMAVVRELGGRRNRVVLCRGPYGLAVAKSTRRSEAALDWLAPVQDRARASGLQSPRLIRSRGGAFGVDGWTLEPWIDGSGAGPKDMAGLCPIVADFHRRTAGMPQRPGFVTATELIEVDRGGDVDLAAIPAPLRAACRQAWRALGGHPVAALHADLCVENILIDRDGRSVLIDWDEARVDATAFDLGALGAAPEPPAIARARLAYEIACCWQIEPDRAAALARRLLGDPLPA